jgi:hypothetical protein
MRRIVVETFLDAPVEVVWQRTQDPGEHVSWDIRFTRIGYLAERDARGYRLMDYRTDVAFGIEVAGIGRYLHSEPLRLSSFEFDSADWKSLIRDGRGIWLYEPRPGGTYFKTVFDYDIRHGPIGRALDRLFFRNLLRLATEWGFETLRQWCAGGDGARRRRRSRWRFLAHVGYRMLGGGPPPGPTRSWLGSGTESAPAGPASATSRAT